MIDYALIIVSYRTAADVDGLLATVPAAVADRSWTAVVVNNDPADTEAVAAVVSAHPHAHLVDAGSNVGYAAGLNLGMSQAPPSRWTVFLNPDVRLSAGSLSMMAEYAGNRSAVVPALVDARGKRQLSLRREPTLLGSLGDALLGNRWPGRPAVLSERILTEAAYDTSGEVDWATGAVLLVPTALAVRVGDWDADHFFLYSEETDYCRRLRAAGASIRYLPEAVAEHTGGGSGSSDDLHALLETNRVRYFRKWHGPRAAMAFAAVAVLNNALRSRRPRNRAALRAILSPTHRATLPGGRR